MLQRGKDRSGPVKATTHVGESKDECNLKSAARRPTCGADILRFDGQWYLGVMACLTLPDWCALRLVSPALSAKVPLFLRGLYLPNEFWRQLAEGPEALSAEERASHSCRFSRAESGEAPHCDAATNHTQALPVPAGQDAAPNPRLAGTCRKRSACPLAGAWTGMVAPLRALQRESGGLVVGSAALQFLERGVGAGARLRRHRACVETLSGLGAAMAPLDLADAAAGVAAPAGAAARQPALVSCQEAGTALLRTLGKMEGPHVVSLRRQLYELTQDSRDCPVPLTDVGWRFADSSRVLRGRLGLVTALRGLAYETVEAVRARHWAFNDIDLVLAATPDNVAALGRFLAACPPTRLEYRDSLAVPTVLGAPAPTVGVRDANDRASANSSGDDAGERLPRHQGTRTSWSGRPSGLSSSPTAATPAPPAAGPPTRKRGRDASASDGGERAEAVEEDDGEGGPAASAAGEGSHKRARVGKAVRPFDLSEEDVRPDDLSAPAPDTGAPSPRVERARPSFALAMARLLRAVKGRAARQKHSSTKHGPAFLVRAIYNPDAKATADGGASEEPDTASEASVDFIFLPCAPGAEWATVRADFDFDLCVNAVGADRVRCLSPEALVTRRAYFRDDTYCKVAAHLPRAAASWDWANTERAAFALRDGANRALLDACLCDSITRARINAYTARGYEVRAGPESGRLADRADFRAQDLPPRTAHHS